MILVNNIKTPVGAAAEEAVKKALSVLSVPISTVVSAHLIKSSLDARNRGQMVMVHSVAVRLQKGEAEKVAALGSLSVVLKEDQAFTLKRGSGRLEAPIIIAGFGPAGMFAADLLAREGYHPIVLERGYPVEERVQAVERFWRTGVLDAACNVQFGEGGAGTFSDGKLTTRINDPICEYVLEQFALHGAPLETLRKAKPHIGTDKLRDVVRSMREGILKNGGEVRFSSQLDGLRFQNGRLVAVSVNGEEIPAGCLILAIGHSARDTFSMLLKSGVQMESKPFSVGARIEHLQSEIDKGLYGDMAGHPALPTGEYQLSHRVGERAVYTFCMCPGGLVVPASSADGQVVTNGMSEYSRNQKNANAALVVSVDQKDFGSGVLDGMRFQEELERRAFSMAGGNYRACGATVGSFLEGRTGFDLKRVEPSYCLGVEPVDFTALLPGQVVEMMRTGLSVFNRKLRGFAAADAVLTGVETRTSSPVRIPRGEDFTARSLSGLYPCGEGAGYAGGIMSAAVDGVRVAMEIIGQYADSPKDSV